MQSCHNPKLTVEEEIISEYIKWKIASKMMPLTKNMNPEYFKLFLEFDGTHEKDFPVEHSIGLDRLDFYCDTYSRIILDEFSLKDLWLLCRKIYNVWINRGVQKDFYLECLSGIYFINPFDENEVVFKRLRRSRYLDRIGRYKFCTKWNNYIPEQDKLLGYGDVPCREVPNYMARWDLNYGSNVE